MAKSSSRVRPPGTRFAQTDEPTTIGGYALAIAKALEHSGVDSSRILQSVGIPAVLTNDPMNRLRLSTLTRLFRACVEVTNNPYFGLTVARFIHISNLHALGYALAASSTLMNFCLRLERYFRLVSQNAEVTVLESSTDVTLCVRQLVNVSAETEDAMMGFVILAMRHLYKPDFNPLRVALHHPMPFDGGTPYETMFRAPVSFSVPTAMLVFAKSDMEQPLAGACAELAQLNDNLATSYMVRLSKDDVVNTVRQRIVEYLPSGDCSREKVASILCMSPTTLQFKLSNHGTNFHELLDSIRRELALSYVQQSALSITEITFLLGFSDTSNFTRAFKRWEGVSPTDFRCAVKATGA